MPSQCTHFAQPPRLSCAGQSETPGTCCDWSHWPCDFHRARENPQTAAPLTCTRGPEVPPACYAPQSTISRPHRLGKVVAVASSATATTRSLENGLALRSKGSCRNQEDSIYCNEQDDGGEDALASVLHVDPNLIQRLVSQATLQ